MPKLVVIIEDSETIAPLEIALSALAEVSIRRFSNGAEAANFLRDPQSGLAAIITDLNLPVLDGFELVAAVRANASYSRLPIIVVSGDVHPDTPARLRKMGVDAFFSKPYSPSQVRDTLEALLHDS